jgi:hypothetical protein
MRKGQFLSRNFGPRRWSRFSAKVIQGQGTIRQAGAGGRSGLESGGDGTGFRLGALFGSWILETVAICG